MENEQTLKTVITKHTGLQSKVVAFKSIPLFTVLNIIAVSQAGIWVIDLHWFTITCSVQKVLMHMSKTVWLSAAKTVSQLKQAYYILVVGLVLTT